MLVVVNAVDRTVDQPGAEHDQTKVQEQQRHEQRHYLPNIVIARGRDEHAQDRQRQSEDGDPGAHGSQRSSFLREEHLDFAKDEIVYLGWFVRFRTHLFSNLIDSAQNSVENRVELVESPVSDLLIAGF